MMTYIQKIQGGGKTVVYERKGDTARFRKTIGNDSFELEINEAGIYATVRMFRGDVWCTEKLYAMTPTDDVFWLYAREAGGRGATQDNKFLKQRAMRYPQGSKVRMKCTLSRESRKSSPSQSTASS